MSYQTIVITTVNTIKILLIIRAFMSKSFRLYPIQHHYVYTFKTGH